jgi:hypothetical protein
MSSASGERSRDLLGLGALEVQRDSMGAAALGTIAPDERSSSQIVPSQREGAVRLNSTAQHNTQGSVGSMAAGVRANGALGRIKRSPPLIFPAPSERAVRCDPARATGPTEAHARIKRSPPLIFPGPSERTVRFDSTRVTGPISPFPRVTRATRRAEAREKIWRAPLIFPSPGERPSCWRPAGARGTARPGSSWTMSWSAR